MRFLGDRVSRATAWTVATRHGWDDIGPAEYVAVALLQADAIVSDEPAILGALGDDIAVAAYDDLFR